MASFICEFREVLARGDDLPTLPAIVLELHATLDNELVSQQEVSAVINLRTCDTSSVSSRVLVMRQLRWPAGTRL